MFGAPDSTYQIEFFANTPIGPSRASGGQTFLDSTTVTTNGRGVALIRFPVPTQSRRAFFTATATSPAHNTSAFSDGVPRSRARLASSRRGRG